MSWIKVRHNLPDDPDVIQIGEILGMDPDMVVGKLIRLWIWADQNLVSRNCHAASVTTSWVDVRLGASGFALAMEQVGWLKILPKGISFPNFDRHMSLSAKERSLAASRKSRERAGLSKPEERDTKKETCHGNVTKKSRSKRDNSVTREEKRREEVNTESSFNKEDSSGDTVIIALLTFPTDGEPRSWALVDPDVQQWQQLFPKLDIMQECREALAWVLAKPANRKTANGMKTFLTGWFTRSSNKKRATTNGVYHPQPSQHSRLMAEHQAATERTRETGVAHQGVKEMFEAAKVIERLKQPATQEGFGNVG